MKHFRIVNAGTYTRVDQRHSLLFGLIKWWDRGASDLCPDYCFPTFASATRAILQKFPYGSLLITKGDNVVHFYRKS